tara:strand:+ start:343 stop:1236 length:894 start_codon:yes stop_codon:yes gene_type:complete
MSWEKFTEQQNAASENIDQKSTIEILEIINKEDEKVAIAVKKSLPKIEKFIDSIIERFYKGGKLFYIGSGTSGRLGVLDASECPPTFRTNPNMVQGIIAGGNNALSRSVEGAEDSPEDGSRTILEYNITEKDVVLGITASSSTPYVLGALKQAKCNNALTGLIICNSPPKLKYIDHMIPIIVGSEVITGSTRMKAGTATKMALNMITTTSMIKLNKTFGNLMVDLHASNKKLWDRGTRIVSKITNLNYNRSLELLTSANGEVKVAIIMNKLNISKEDAKVKIDKHKGSLRTILSKNF